MLPEESNGEMVPRMLFSEADQELGAATAHKLNSH
jgi:hypothetical protein